MGPRVAMKAVAMPPRAPKQKIVATALLERISVVMERHMLSDIPKTQSVNGLCEHPDRNGSQHCINGPTKRLREGNMKIESGRTDHHMRRLHNTGLRTETYKHDTKHALVPNIFRLSMAFRYTLYSTGLDTTCEES